MKPTPPEITAARKLLSALVAIPSVNPRREIPKGPPFGEGRLADHLGRLLERWGGRVVVGEISPGRPNLLARFAGRDRSRTLLLEAHADTVSIEGMTVPPFRGVVRGGRLYGRGACDTKGPMAAILLGLREILTRDGRPPTDVLVASTCDEELGANGAVALMASGLRADAAVVGEPTDLDVIRAHKGAVRWRIAVRGVAAHSAHPERGVNAILVMQPVIAAFAGPVALRAAARSHPLLGAPTVNVGTIRGGAQVNMVPDRCEIEAEWRMVPGETTAAVTADIRRILTREAKGVRFSIEIIQHYPPFEEDAASPVARLVMGACRRILGRARFATARWAANSGVFKRAGIPCVLFGPGSIRQAHTKDEYIVIADVARAARVYAEIIRAF
ncbi:MAG: M20 family metallopeptidase [Planctomycetota bacterium]